MNSGKAVKIEDARVLVVDDEESIRFSFQFFLKNFGYHVEVASNIEDAMALISEEEFDAAIIDNIFPQGQNGMDLIAYLNDIQPYCQAVLVSGYQKYKSSSKGVNCRTFASLLKPVKQEDLLNTVKRAIEEARRTK